MFDRERERGVTDKGGRNAACRHEKVALDEVFVEALFNGGGIRMASPGRGQLDRTTTRGRPKRSKSPPGVKDGVKEGKQNIKGRRSRWARAPTRSRNTQKYKHGYIRKQVNREIRGGERCPSTMPHAVWKRLNLEFQERHFGGGPSMPPVCVSPGQCV